MEKLRVPGLYVDYDLEDNYWKLSYLLDGKLKPPANPHPLLGWVGDFSRDTFLHNEAFNIKGRKAVLLYGDSFAGCLTPKEECFQGILNADDEFAARGYLLNYGVGNYGVDQIYLLLKNSLHHFQDPFVIASVLTQDVDRSTLSVRIGQKPYFELVDGELVLQGIPINSDPKAFFAENPPTIPSYLFRLWVQRNGWPQQVRQYFKGIDHIRNKRIMINEKLLLNMIHELRRRHLQHIFVIFHVDHAVQNVDWKDWQNDLIERVLRENHEPYISAKEIVRQHLREHNGSIDDYYIKGDGHPTALQNKILAEAMKKVVLDAIGRNIARSSAPEATDALPPPRCTLSFAAGWHAQEHNGSTWWRWTDGRGELQVVTAEAGEVLLHGELTSLHTPNSVEVWVNDAKVATWQVSWQGFKAFEPVRLRLTQGANRLVLVSQNAAMRLPSDSRPLAVAVSNLHATGAHGAVVCELQLQL